MRLFEINPYLRHAELQPSVMSRAPLSCAYDYRIFYILEGSTDLVLEDRVLPLTAGSLLYFRPATPYYFDGDVKVIVLNFDLTRNQQEQSKPRSPSRNLQSFDHALIFENDPPKELKSLVFLEKAFDFETRIQECLLHFRYPSPFSDAITSAILKELLCSIAQHAAEPTPKLPELVQRIMLYIQQHYDQEISNAQISAEFGYHSYYLNRIFKSSTGITIHQAVLQEKMRIAKRMLKETDLSVGAVAGEVGFLDDSHFSIVFKKQTGCTPSEYRKKKQSRQST